MIFDKALRKRSGAVQKSSGSAMLTLESPKGWIGWTAEDEVAMSRDKAMRYKNPTTWENRPVAVSSRVPARIVDKKTRPPSYNQTS